MIKAALRIHQKTASTTALVDCLADTLNRKEILYSHWKSNIDLAQAVAGRTDLDLLVERKSLSQMLTSLSHLGFKAAMPRWGANPPGIGHYYGLDPDTEQLIHVHLFSRVLTGESYVKSHLFPFEAMLLENVHYVDQIRVTSKPAELVLFTLRMFVKYGSLMDLVSLWRKSDKIKAEILWLQDGGDLSEALSLFKANCPVIDEKLFVKCVKTLNNDTPLIRRMILARHVRRRLKVYAKHGFFRRLMAYLQLLWAELQRRLGTKQKNKVLQSGGAIIAFTGADATGKSTLVAETGRWLGDTFTVRTIHAGKPPSTWLTAPVNIAFSLARSLISLQRVRRLKRRLSPSDSNPSRHHFEGLSSLPYALRAIALAWDRQRLTLKARQLAAKGEIIICDRYPSAIIGNMDSPRLEEEPLKTGPVATIYNRLAQVEKQLYRQIPPADIVLKLNVSVETAKKRNRNRNEQDGDAYLEARHRQSLDGHMPGTRYVNEIDTEQTLEETVRDVKKALWESL